MAEKAGHTEGLVQVDEVTKVYLQGHREVRALAGVTLTVPRGEFLSIMGPSGSGKSTLLHLMGGLDRPTTGRLTVDGAALSEMPDTDVTIFRRERVGLIFQFFNLLPTLTAAENVALPLLLDGKRMKDVRARVESLLEVVGLADRSAHRPDELSGGEMQRVAIARALVVEPRLLLADEPTGNLDSVTATEILELLRSVHQGKAPTIVMVTHDPRAAEFGDRVIRLRDGKIEEDRRTARS
ncbi:MAG: ABC transporter ATP-binding protein [Deltaproteobacteria bacterium]|nr:ABC transporter ATP-binding protein [Deltaproteobacteria bacterium]